MGYRKFKADHLFTGRDLLDGNNILITNENGVIENIADEKDAGDDLELFEGIISPGFVNCHCHLELSHMKNVIENETGLVDFLIKVVSLREAEKEEIVSKMLEADEEMYHNGIVAVGDICNTTASIGIKQKSKMLYYNFIEAIGFTEDKANAAVTKYTDIYKDFCGSGFIEYSCIVPHAPYTISRAVFNLINDLSEGKTVSIHNQESFAENELYRTKTGDFLKLYQYLNINTGFFQPYDKSSLQSYLPLLNKPAKLLLVHNTFSEEADIEFALNQTHDNTQQLYWCLCPNANLYIENRLPPVESLRQKKCNIVLGTDSYSSNRSLNILDEMKTLQKHFPLLTPGEILQWATFNGAAALNMQHIAGSFKKGMKPGIVLINNISHKKINMHTLAKRLL
jgi:cytosine/adenosine deaminase-related metal-dependent hydrolase